MAEVFYLGNNLGSCSLGDALGPSTMGWALPGDAPTKGCDHEGSRAAHTTGVLQIPDAKGRLRKAYVVQERRADASVHIRPRFAHKLSQVPRGHSCTSSPSNLQDWIFLAESLAQAQCFIVIKDD